MGTVIVVGMHRSGTSLLANLLEKCGLFVGDRLLEGTFSNRKGHFEDEDFKDLHEDIFEANHPLSMYIDGPLKVEEPHRERARMLVEARADIEHWGWKDPRTTLFLDLWREVVPDASFVFIFRRPDQVVDSLRRRRTDPGLLYFFPGWRYLTRLGLPLFRCARAVEMWNFYNRRVIAFARAHPEQSKVIDLDRIHEQFPETVDWLQRRGVELQPIEIDEVLDDRLLTRDSSASVRRACRRNVDCDGIYDELIDLSKL